MNVAITGATGFLGSHLAEALARRGDGVTCLVRSPRKAEALRALGCRLVVGDLDREGAVRELVRDADVVYHAAALTAAPTEREYFRVNRGGTEQLARAVRASGPATIVYVSSLAATGPSRRGAPAHDATLPQPVTHYGRSKLAGEDALRRSEVPFVIIRPPTVYGPGDRQVLRLFRFARRGVAPVLGDGRQELSLVYVTDLVAALLAVGGAERAVGRTYHVAHPEIVTQRDLILAIGAALDRAVRVIAVPVATARAVLGLTGAAARLAGVTTLLNADKAHEFLAPAWTCSSDGIARDTGWRAPTDLGAGARATAAWYRAAGWL